MKTSASILLSFAMGALVAVALTACGSPAREPAVVPPAIETQPVRAPEPKQPPTRATEKPPVRNAPPLLSIPRLDLRARIGANVDDGPAWWPVTGRPGGGDTIAIAGHRTTHTRPFYELERLQTGDAIYVRWLGRTHVYRVSGRRILSAKNLHIGDARGHEILLLSACHPRGSARQRIVVYAWPEPA